ncbi:glycosyltransferase family 9 protein [Agromyces aerolatus]|uniref:glycosyltransferase family 9 protein n=1 Tax=Agromyces sp. LY-1074 TaxID=3074080 RepID=UPI0028627741|nr:MULTISPECIES: glycosyltransferase family 9 protein [unclassified Agromyces]MDR5700583.1 glycosyltransferase family 9 protein [Agromyces sp. LY-1074]MDR5707104.1 glycosyltransferase family 9 protein [Agromyces sp. LY-1358]
MSVVAVAERPFPGVRRIAVLRGGGLGDLVVALPAIDALGAAYPHAEITLLGSPLHAELLRGRLSPVSHVEVLPVAPGIRDPGHDESADRVDEFRARLARHGPIDLGVQLHGGGRYANPFLLALAPGHTVGLATDDAERLDRTLPYVYYQHEVMRWLEVAALAGAPPVTLEPQIVLTESERAAIEPFVPQDEGPLVTIHPGASDPRRRWPAGRFAQVAAALLDDGAHVRLIGSDADGELAQRIAGEVRGLRDGAAGDRIAVLAGRLTIGETAALAAASDVMIANDSGPRHLAQAVGAATVGVFWFGNVVNAAPFSRARHRVHLSFTVRCPVCGADVTQVGWTAPRCEHDVSFVADVKVAPVLADARQLMATSSLRSDRRAVRGSRRPAAG